MKRYMAIYLNEGQSGILPLGVTMLFGDAPDDVMPDLDTPEGGCIECIIDALGRTREGRTSWIRVTTPIKTRLVPCSWKTAMQWAAFLDK